MELLPVETLKTALIAGHLLGLAFGVGGALTLDIIAFRYFYLDRITPEKLVLFHFIARLVTVGLVILWITGLAFLWLYWQHQPELLGNPKVWAKVTIVVVLTVNGYFLHHKVFPILDRNLGRYLFYRVNVDEKAMMFTFSSISIISWGFPLVLGIARSLNFTTGVENILAFYFLMLASTCFVMLIIFKLFLEPFKRFVIDRPARQRIAPP
ncbi:hypothetical protein SAMN05216203_0429 [Marinobacter daqiaonensis]|uniref:Uncharacterized protein n=1 Tax=Marinobacter daqiaonensis TaxID=650891 RepID=A0A1I6GSF6_9GAMM|nr:hypothetical protein [Marinobacter daqiaonensis]SFR45110.1 hypothetical protein SAMN05216203_0429 [Marinobacter daqiaonensis]